MGNTFYQAIHLGIPVARMLENQPWGSVVFAGYKQKDNKNPPKANSPEEYI
uniref:hypothetical protein n=1 Tax=Prochlorococcus marinus TaxID=1219 RepID=UPI00030F0815|nr:hypothetical protein [Prochlorococcus marinus]